MLKQPEKARRRLFWLRIGAGTVLFVASEMALLGAAEGFHKGGWIETATVPNILLTLGFWFL